MQDIFDRFTAFFNDEILTLFTPKFLIILASFIGSVVLLTILKSIVNRIIRKKEFKSKELVQMLGNMVYIVLLFILVSVHFSGSSLLNTVVFKLGESDVTMLILIIAAFIIIFSLKLSSFVRRYVLPGAYDKYELDDGTKFTFNRIFHYAVLVLAVLITLNILGINITSLTVFASLFGVGIGFGMQNIISNFISGIIILFERPIKVGDRVIVDGILGEVLEIKIRATIVRSLDNEHIIVPNSYFLEQRIVNRSYGDLKVRITVDVGVSYSSDVEKVRELLFAAADSVRSKTGYILKTPAPIVRFTSFGDSSLDFKLLVWVDVPAHTYDISSDLHFEVLRLFRENGIEIPFPQTDVHMKKD